MQLLLVKETLFSNIKWIAQHLKTYEKSGSIMTKSHFFDWTPSLNDINIKKVRCCGQLFYKNVKKIFVIDTNRTYLQ